MRKILIYRDKGTNPFCISSLLWALKHENLDQTYQLSYANKEVFQGIAWQKETDLVIFPGGRDIPYHQALSGEGNRHIADFVHQGGSFLGLCAGGYYGSSMIEFELGGPLEVLANRELKFFPGIARGPAYGLGRFCYQNERGAQIAQLSTPLSVTAAYYNGGCAFIEAENYSSVSIIARYADIETQPAAIIKCTVGKGLAVLSGVHPEYSADFEYTKRYIKGPQFFALKKIEKQRCALFKSILHQLLHHD